MKSHTALDPLRTWSAQQVGVFGESLSLRVLKDRGLHILTRNWRPSGQMLRGELDVVALDRGTLVVCEVKTRRTDSAGAPQESVTPEKIRTLRRLTSAYLSQSTENFDEVRLDVIAVTLVAEKRTGFLSRAQVTWLQGVDQ